MKIEVFGVTDKTLTRKYKLFARNVLEKVSRKIPGETKTLNIIIVNDKYIHKLNKQFLGRNRVTDVLSFPINHELLGEIYISKDRARLQAKEQNIHQTEEIYNLIEHGILHLLGFSHQEMSKTKR
jgi:probable rRNA maturation factor